jgi:alkylhydroperoxidase family enzyme
MSGPLVAFPLNSRTHKIEASTEADKIPSNREAYVVARIPYPRRDEYSPELSDLLNKMPRVGVVEMLTHAPRLAESVLRLLQAQFTSLELSLRHRELLILTVAGKIGCDYEYQQHIPISAAAGVEPALREALWTGNFDNSPPVTNDDHALIEFVGLIVDGPKIDEDKLTEFRSYFSDREVVEILQLVGSYWGLGRLCTILDVDVEISDNLDAINAISNLPDPIG